MIRDKEIEFELSKLQKQVDKKSVTNITKIYNQTSQSASPAQTLLGKSIATDMGVKDGQIPVYNGQKKQWEAGTVSGVSSYNDLTDKPTIPDISGKQDTLVSGTNIKTINSTSLLGSGNIEISGSGLSQPQILARTLGC